MIFKSCISSIPTNITERFSMIYDECRAEVEPPATPEPTTTTPEVTTPEITSTNEAATSSEPIPESSSTPDTSTSTFNPTGATEEPTTVLIPETTGDLLEWTDDDFAEDADYLRLLQYA